MDTMSTAHLFLPAPRHNWLLAAGTQPTPRYQETPLPDLSYEARRLLDNAELMTARIPDAAYFPVHSAYGPYVEELLTCGAFEKHPDARKRTWCGITEYGRTVARRLRTKALLPQQRRLIENRMAAYEEMRHELLAQGYYELPEPGRGPELGEVAFFNIKTGRKLLMRTRIGDTDWRERDMGYYKAIEEVLPFAMPVHVPSVEEMLAEIPF